MKRLNKNTIRLVASLCVTMLISTSGWSMKPLGDMEHDKYEKSYSFRVEIIGGAPSNRASNWKSFKGGKQELLRSKPMTGATKTSTSLLGEKIANVVVEGTIFEPSGSAGSADMRQKLFTNQFTLDLDPHTVWLEVSPLSFVVKQSSTRDGRSTSVKAAGPRKVKLTIGMMQHADTIGNTRDWYKDAAEGKEIRKDLTLQLGTSELRERPTFTFRNCTPVSYLPNEGIGIQGGAVLQHVLTVSCNRFEVTTGRRDVDDWVRAMTERDNYKRNLSLTLLNRDGADSRTVNYMDTVIHKLVLPRFDRNEQDVEALMELHIRPSRVEQTR